MSKAVIEKAQRLLHTGRVSEIHNRVRVFRVDGDHGQYSVVVGATVSCTCPASQPDCAHVTAVLLQIRDEETR